MRLTPHTCSVQQDLSFIFLARDLWHGVFTSTANPSEQIRRLHYSQLWDYQIESAFGHQNTHNWKTPTALMMGSLQYLQSWQVQFHLHLHQAQQQRHLELLGHRIKLYNLQDSFRYLWWHVATGKGHPQCQPSSSRGESFIEITTTVSVRECKAWVYPQTLGSVCTDL